MGYQLVQFKKSCGLHKQMLQGRKSYKMLNLELTDCHTIHHGFYDRNQIYKSISLAAFKHGFNFQKLMVVSGNIDFDECCLQAENVNKDL